MTLAARLDHTLLRPDCTEGQVQQLCREAAEHHLASVCVPPCHVALAAQLLINSGVKVGTVVGFPFGYADLRVKYKEAEIALAAGATELDMVMNISALKSGRLDLVQGEIEDIAALCHVHEAVLKVIIETALLTEAEIRQVAALCAGDADEPETAADYVKTSTGYASRGASLDDVRLLRELLPARIKIKASGGIRSRAAALALVAAGADRIGSSNSLALLDETDEQAAV